MFSQMKCTLVMKIPTFLYETLLDQRDEKSLRIEHCKGLRVCFNWTVYLSTLT